MSRYTRIGPYERCGTPPGQQAQINDRSHRNLARPECFFMIGGQRDRRQTGFPNLLRTSHRKHGHLGLPRRGHSMTQFFDYCHAVVCCGRCARSDDHGASCLGVNGPVVSFLWSRTKRSRPLLRRGVAGLFYDHVEAAKAVIRQYGDALRA